MTKEEQLTFGWEANGVQALLDSAASVLDQTWETYFSYSVMPEDLKTFYTDVSNMLFVANHILFEARAELDCLCGDESKTVQRTKRNHEKLMEYLNIAAS